MSASLSRTIVRIVAAIALVFLSSGATVHAQEGSPTPECVAPALPAGTSTPLDDNGMPIGDKGAATPEAAIDDAMADHDTGSDETPASAEVAAAAEAGLNNAIACLNSGDYLSLAALMTADMIQFVTEFSTNPYDVPVMMEGAVPIEVVATGDSVVDEEGRVGVAFVYRGLFLSPGTLGAERWYLVEDDGVWKVDGISMTTVPEGFMPEATIVGVDMVDFAFAIGANEIPAGPVIFRFSNTSYSHQGHVGAVLTLTEGYSTEQIISGEELPEDQVTGFFGAIFLEPGATADLVFETLGAGTYTLACDIPTPDGVEHWQLGMAAQFDVV